MGFLKKLGKKLHKGKKLGQKLTGDIGKLGKKSGRVMENVGKAGVLIGMATGQPEIVAGAEGLMAGGQAISRGGQVFRDTSKGKLEKAVGGTLSLASDMKKHNQN